MRCRMGRRMVWHSRMNIVFLKIWVEAKSSGRLDLMLDRGIRFDVSCQRKTTEVEKG